MHQWFKRFRKRYSYSIRKTTKFAQTLPKNYMENIREYIYTAIKDNIEKNISLYPNIVANVDETPIVLEPITSTTIEKRGTKTITVHTFGKLKERISCILCIFGNGMKAPPMLAFKGVPENLLEKKLNNLKVVLEKKIYISCQQNAWVDSNIFIKWLNKIWFRTYPFREIKESILYFDKAPSHMIDEVDSLFKKFNSKYRVIPPGLTSVCQPLDLCINKPFKDALRAKYREFCIIWKNTKKPTPEHVINWVSEIWWSNIISEETIKKSFKKGGIILNMDGSEDYYFNWPKQPDLTFVEDFTDKSGINNNNKIDFYFQEKNNNEEIQNDDEEEDILFDYDRYSISSIRKEVLDDNISKKNDTNSEMDIEESDYITKDYNYYKAYGLFG